MTNKIVKLYHNGEEYYIDEYQEGWKPGDNTLLYLPLKSDVVDKSGKSGRTFTTSGISYTTVGGVPSIHVGSTGGIYMSAPNPLINSATMDKTKQTISVLYYVTSQTSSSRRELLEFSKYNSEYFSLALKENTSLVQYSDANDWFGSGTTIVANKWNNVIVTGDSSARKIYINGTLAWTGSGSSNPRGKWQQTHEERQGILCDRNGSYGDALNGNARELILEDKVWTAEDVSNYYQRIKKELGI